MKAAIITSIYNKNKCLSNTLHAISKQKTSFPLEVCIIDDHSNINPEPIVRKFLPDAKYKRLKKYVGPKKSKNICLDLVSPDTHIIIPISCDVIIAQSLAIEKLCRYVGYKTIALAEVSNIPVNERAFKNFDKEIGKILKNWERLNTYEAEQVGRQKPHAWIFFLGAIRKEDLIKLDYKKNSCDAVIAPKMKAAGFKANLLSYVKGIHQAHSRQEYSCPLVNECQYFCSRTKQLKNLLPDENYYKEANIIT